MDKTKFPIYLTTVILVVYTFLGGMDLGPALVLMVFGISPLFVIRLVYCVLRDGWQVSILFLNVSMKTKGFSYFL